MMRFTNKHKKVVISEYQPRLRLLSTDALIEAALITGLAHSHLLLPKNVKDCNNIVSDLIGTHAINELTERKGKVVFLGF